MEVLLDVPDVSRTDPKVILAHYEADLSELGLKKTTDRWSVRGGQVLWSSPDDDLWARFDAEVNEQSRTVKVQMLFVDERQLQAW